MYTFKYSILLNWYLIIAVFLKYLIFISYMSIYITYFFVFFSFKQLFRPVRNNPTLCTDLPSHGVISYTSNHVDIFYHKIFILRFREKWLPWSRRKISGLPSQYKNIIIKLQIICLNLNLVEKCTDHTGAPLYTNTSRLVNLLNTVRVQ